MRFRYKMLLLFTLLLFSLVPPGCANSGTSPPSCPSFPAQDCRIVIPQCQPPAIAGMPHDALTHLGFLPYVAIWLPKAVTWYTAEPYLSSPSQPRPLMRIGYGYWFPRPYNAYALHGVIAFDETKQELDFTTNIYVPGQTLAVTSKVPVDINGHTGTLFELQSSGATGANKDDETRVIGVEWQEGGIWVRATAVTSGRYAILANGEGDDVLAWDGMSTDVLLRVARSARPYTGCPRSVSGVS